MMLKIKFAIIALLIISTQNVMAQSKTIKGVVTDPSGVPLPGASINVQGTNNSASTDFDGNYALQGVNATDKITYSYVGLTSQTITVGDQTVINIKLAESTQTLNEVVIAYGSQKKDKVTGAISTVNSKDIVAVPITNAESALQGRAAGVTVIAGGSPGSNPTVLIRGLGTLNNNAPLYVIDGVTASNLSGLSPNDIESMSVLKDASTTALYGSQAFNGVIVVTTKKGKKGAGQLNFNTYTGFQTITKRYDVLNTEQYVKFASELGVDIAARAASFGNQTVDYQDEIFQTGLMQDYNLSFSNGTETSSSRYSAEILKQDGAVINTGFERYSFRANNSQKIGKLELGSNIGVSFSKRNAERTGTGRTLLEHAIKAAPYLPIYNADNLGGYQGPSAIDGQDAENPVRIQNLGYAYDKTISILGNIYAEYEIIKGLKFRSQVSLDYSNLEGRSFVPSFRDGSYTGQSFATINRNGANNQTIVFDNSLSYKTTIANKHNIDAILLIEKNENQRGTSVASGTNNITNDVDQLNNSPSTTLSYKTNKLGYVARINYDYDDKYLLAVSGRRDGSSRFGPNNRWGNFYSVAVGWNISKEAFMSDTGFSTLKLRGSIGTTGNDNFADYQYSASLPSNYYYVVNGVSVVGTSLGRAANPDLKWESKLGRNIGLDFGLFDDKFTGTIEYFNNTAKDILFNVPVPTSLGILNDNRYENIAAVNTSGWELSLGYNDRKGEFTWSANLNFGTSKNEVVALAPGVTSVIAGVVPRAGLAQMSRLTVGDPLFYMYGLVTDGIYQNQAEVNAVFTKNPGQTAVKPGDIRFKDLNGDGDITSDDRTNIGNQFPDFTYGLNLSAAYKNFDFNCFISGSKGSKIFNASIFDLQGMTRLFNSSTAVLDRAVIGSNGAVSNPDATLPRALGAPQNTAVSDRYVEDGSFTRLKNITLGYTFKGTALDKYVSKLRLYASAQNLVTWTKYSGLDPEIAGTGFDAGIDLGRYPQPKSVILGLEVSF
ncbi:TonB-dependent receptor [Flavobacterium cheongpyeongense]|jgi:TonB-dependent starch-binding outer membrane protein SusC|uniref:TonB-dependent receptor n=1 Tax=Flavobacterium cheongpyeongense TaxID=2212651 RepID=A0A2V4BL96_9FLAO|nr:TonB-dependent receptor [Flavobacterium cheongpyeongense]PXY39736.1 TonB-dependent receptor [Flavobacterium cheongpyeongense]